MAASAQEDAALRQLQRLDGEIAQVVAKSRHVATYTLKFDSSGREIWERDKMEGGLFLVRRRIEPLYAICVLNRLTTTDLIQQLRFGSPDFELEFPSAKNFLIFRTQSLIKAIWFAEEEEPSRGYDEIRTGIERAEREVLSIPPVPRHVSMPNREDGGDPILSMGEMRDSLFRLLSNDKFMQTLHSQYVQAEQRRRQQVQHQGAVPPVGNMMMHPPHHFVHHPSNPVGGNVSSPSHDQAQPQQFMSRGPTPVGPQGAFMPSYQPSQPPWNSPPQGPFPMSLAPGGQQQQPPATSRPGMYPISYQKQ